MDQTVMTFLLKKSNTLMYKKIIIEKLKKHYPRVYKEKSVQHEQWEENKPYLVTNYSSSNKKSIKFPRETIVI